MKRDEVRQLLDRLYAAQRRVTDEILDTASFESLACRCPAANTAPDGTDHGGFTVNDMLRMWTWHFWTHHRDLVMARGRLVNDNPHFHVPHHVREASEQFGKFIGELACMTDEQLDQRVPGGRSAREVVLHVLEALEGYFVDQVRRAKPAGKGTE
jgi:hypothetical protein